MDFLFDKLNVLMQKKNKSRFFVNLLKAYWAMKNDTFTASLYPVKINLEPTDLCNLNCPTCPTGSGKLKRRKGIMTYELFKKIIDETGDYLFSLIFFGYGEPFICKEYVDMIKYAVNRGIWVWTSTNGHFFNDETFVEELVKSGVHHILVCFDGLSQDTVSEFRKGASFEDTVAGAKRIIKAKKKLNKKYPYLELQFIKMKHNKNEEDKVKLFAEELGFDRFSVKNVGIAISDPDFVNMAKKYLPDGIEGAGYIKKGEDGKYRYIFDPKISCKWLYYSPFITWNGLVVPCCYDLFGDYVLGDVSRETIREIWNNNSFKGIRKKVKSSRNNLSICKACPEDRRPIYDKVTFLKK